MADQRPIVHDSAVLDHTLVEPSPLDTDEIPILASEPAPRAVWSRTWVAGGAAVALAVFEALSGLVLMFHYRPLVPAAHFDVVDLVEVSPLGFVRELHLWGAHLLLIAAALHLFRVVVAGAYRPPRQVNYHLGLVLGCVMGLLALTGFVLPWDERTQAQLAFLGLSSAPGGATLTFAYALHCGLLPVCGVLLVAVHLRRAVRDSRAGASAAPQEPA